jgi:hypothetical protein
MSLLGRWHQYLAGLGRAVAGVSRPRSPSWKPNLEDLEARTLLSYSSLVYPGADGRLVYVPDDQGNTIPDFSDVGYMSGVVPLPGTPGGVVVPTRATVFPAPGDATARIQAAIDQVSQLPLDANGFRGAVRLEAGEYDIASYLEIRASGVILRGIGRDPNTGTRLLATGTDQRYDQNNPLAEGVIRIEGDTTGINLLGSGRPPRASGPGGQDHQVLDSYVPVGATSFTLDSTAGLNVGDTIIVHRPSTHDWLSFIGMSTDQYGSAGWADNSKDLDSDRIITGIDGNTITIDAPLTQALDQQFGGGTVYKYSFPGRITNVGVQNLLGDSTYTSPTDENHAWTFINLVGVANAFVSHISAYHFAFSAVDIHKTSKWVTVQDAYNRDPISQLLGGRRYSFNVDGQLTLVRDAHTLGGRHDFVQGSIVPGPNVFVDCTAEQAYDESGPHDRYSTGTLFDNVIVQPAGTSSDRGALSIHNRGQDSTGSLQGWTGANMVVWNSTATTMDLDPPPGAQVWAIGDTADNASGGAFWESFGAPVEPRSLYDAQLQDRLSQDRPLGHAPAGFGALAGQSDLASIFHPESAASPLSPDHLGTTGGEGLILNQASCPVPALPPDSAGSLPASSPPVRSGADGDPGQRGADEWLKELLD